MMQDYLEALAKGADFGLYFTSDVVLTVMGTDQRVVGREAAEQQMRNMHERAFDARVEVTNLLVDDDRAAVEADFAGTHIGEFAGIVPAGRAVRVPYSVVYDLRGDATPSRLRPGGRRLPPRWAELAGAPIAGIMKQVIDRATVSGWLAGYEAAWRAPGTEGLAGLFTSDATYLQSPYEQPVTGLDAIKRPRGLA
jgi:predicted ester cyclase